MHGHAKLFAKCKSDQHYFVIGKLDTLNILTSHCSCKGHAKLIYTSMLFCLHI